MAKRVSTMDGGYPAVGTIGLGVGHIFSDDPLVKLLGGKVA